MYKLIKNILNLFQRGNPESDLEISAREQLKELIATTRRTITYENSLRRYYCHQ